MFNTYEELKEKFPIGTVYRGRKIEHTNYYYNLEDIRRYQTMYDRIFIIGDTTCMCIKNMEYKIEGYLFDGTSWYPAKQTLDGWEPINEDEIKAGGILNELYG